MTEPSPISPEPVVIDTMLAGALFTRRDHPLVARYRAHLLGRPLVLSFATVAELRYGAYKSSWGEAKVERLTERISQTTVVMPDDEVVETCAQLRVQCHQRGHALHDKIHDADRWIASTAIRFGLALVSDDSIFVNAPGLILRREDAVVR